MSSRVSITLFVLLSLTANAQEKEAAKDVADPNVLFQSGTKSALFATVTGSWKSYDYKGKKIIRLNPEPVQQCRVELGPILRTYNVSIKTKVLAENKRRLSPRMGVGVFGEYGFFLRLTPARKKLELVQYGEVIAEAPCEWQPSRWQFIMLRVTAQATHWKVEGTTWAEGKPEPKKATLTHKAFPADVTHPLYGRASLVGSPFNGLPIYYDEILVLKEDPES